MIAASPTPGFPELFTKLTAKARTLAEARAARLALEAAHDPRRWRRAALLWPLFARN